MWTSAWFLGISAIGALGCSDPDPTPAASRDPGSTDDGERAEDGTDSEPAPPPVTPPAPGDRECSVDADCQGEIGLDADADADAGGCVTAVCLPGRATCAAVAAPDGTPCDDGDGCTLGDRCVAGLCQAREALDCDDSNPCTVGDRCEGGACVIGPSECACETDADCVQHDDGDLCTGVLVCDGGQLPFRCVRDPDSVPRCPEGDACKRSWCEAGQCLTADSDCDDGDECTADSCRPVSGCVRLPVAECAQCQGLECAPCSRGVACAPEGVEGLPRIEGTCCAAGDGLVHLAQGRGSEVVDVETDGEFAYLCGGFGMTVNDVRNPARPQLVGDVEGRCQRMAMGPPHPDGGRVVYVAHHGDSWVRLPFLATWHRATDGALAPLGRMESAEILFEGMVWHRGHLYSATHGGGLRRYRTGERGLPAFVDVVGGFDNAWKIAALGDHLYVADGPGGLKVVVLPDPDAAADPVAAPAIVAAHPTRGFAKDVAVGGGRVFVAMGGAGVDVFDIVEPGRLEPAGHIESVGSAEAVSVGDSVLAVAEWRHVATYDPVSLRLVATEDVRAFPDFDEHTAVASHGDLLFVGEWEGLHVLEHLPGRIAPDIYIAEDLLEFPADRRTARALIIRNRGLLPLEIEEVSVADPEHFSVDVHQLTIEPGGADVLEVTFDPGLAEVVRLRSRLTLLTNDPDVVQDPLDLYLIAEETHRVDIGEPMPAELAFVDPTGAEDLDNLRGHVTVLAYFALF